MSIIKLRIVHSNFILLFTVRNNLSVNNLKEKIYNSEVFVNYLKDVDMLKCNLFWVKKCQVLENSKQLDFYKFDDNDEVILTTPMAQSSIEDLEKAIDVKVTDKDIEEATKHLEGKHLKIIHEKAKSSNDKLLRSVLITLIEVSQNMICLNKSASDLFQYVQKEIRSDTDTPLIVPDQSLINTLMEMGFERDKAMEALRITHNSLHGSINWICNDRSQESHELLEKKDQNSTINWLTDKTGDLFVKPMPAKVILNLYRDYNRKFFRPHVALRERLVDMGFDIASVNESLRINNNIELSAVDTLLNPVSLISCTDDESELESLDIDSDLMKIIFGNAEIQLGLLNIYSLLAFLNIVDNPKNLSHWLANPETKGILQHISSITTDYECSF